MKLVIGLGNPGFKYRNTRHNVGFMVVDAFAKQLKEKWQNAKKLPAEYLQTMYEGKKIAVLKPLTYMNNSGTAVAHIAQKNGINENDILVIHDDKDIAFGKIKVEKDRSSAGHNGIKSIIERLGTQDFWRIRIGVANEELEKMETEKFVLKKFNRAEKKELENIVKEGIEELQRWI